MKEYSFDIEFITPLFMSGADQKVAELRDPSIKGVLCYWFRAMMGKVLSDDFSKMREKEGKLFGNTYNEKSLSAAKFCIEVKEKHNGFKEIDATLNNPGIKYLGFPFYPGKNVVPPRSGIAVNSKYACTFSLQHVCSESEDKVLPSTIWLLSNFGSFGSRSRRGFDCFRTVNQPDSIEGFSFALPQSLDKLAPHLQSGLRQAESIFVTYANQPQETSTTAKIPQFNSFSNWMGMNAKVHQIFIFGGGEIIWQQCLLNSPEMKHLEKD